MTEPLEIDTTLVEEAIRRLQWLATGTRERSTLQMLEISTSATWVMGSTERAAAILYVAAHGLALADEDDAAGMFATLRHTW